MNKKKKPLTSKEETLREMLEDTIWMAIRYAHGRHTYAPSMVREVVAQMKRFYPDWKLRPDDTIKPPEKDMIGGMSFRADYLDDIFEPQ